jgi:hypothetical protein
MPMGFFILHRPEKYAIALNIGSIVTPRSNDTDVFAIIK